MIKKLSVSLLPGILICQVDFSGYVEPSGMFRLSDGKEISLPFRMSQVRMTAVFGDFDFHADLSLEYRWSNSELTPDLREAYIVWYPSFGEVRIGKQILAWGAADGNNPTDNLNPYDNYYMFLPGTERKVGVLSASIKYYSDWWNLEAVLIPQHTGNRIPFDEPDFPLSQSTDRFDPRDSMVDIENPLEVGFRWQINLNNADFSVSILDARDRSFSLLDYEILHVDNIYTFIPYFGYRKTQMLGLDGVTFYQGVTFRGETAYFKTKNDFTEFQTTSLEADAEYMQYVLQAEFTAPGDLSVSTQLIGNKILKVNGNTYDLFTSTRTKLNEENFSPGMGTPFAVIADRGLMLSLSRSFMEDILELSGNTFYNLEMNSFMVGGNIDYSFRGNVTFLLGFRNFSGNENEPNDRFNTMENFSHIFIGAKYRI